uniref:CSON005826 protein n=1 Tax=Culicoides sonorensis TaxID=179676 RepID=A0A336LYD7_CULSO
MALLGAQLVITLVMVSIIQKLSPHLSFAKYLICSTGLLRYLHPTDDELKTLAGVPKEKSKGKGKNGHFEYTSSTFHVPRNLEVTLETAKITPFDVVHLRYFTEYQWLLDFSLYALIVYLISEIYHFFIPLKDEVNLSMLWCLLVVFFAFKLLASLTIQYFKSDESIGECSTCIVTGLVFLLLAMMILIVPESKLEVGLDQAYYSFNESASAFLQTQGLQSTGPASKLIVKFTIAVTCAILGAFFTFPGLRMARMHYDSLKYCKDRFLIRLLLNISFALPFFLVLLWIKPISKDYLTSHILSGMSEPLLTPAAFDTIRLGLVIFTVLLRIALMPIYLQAYLNLAYDRIEDMKKEAGRITNTELQRKISSIFYYLCVVTLQYVAPIIMCMFFAFMYKTLGGLSWNGTVQVEELIGQCPMEPPTPTVSSADAVENLVENVADAIEDSNIFSTAKYFQTSLQGLKNIFTTEVYRGIFGFATWWSCFVWFTTSSLGMFYQTYFTKT